jgi:hypothetical protein
MKKISLALFTLLLSAGTFAEVYPEGYADDRAAIVDLLGMR